MGWAVVCCDGVIRRQIPREPLLHFGPMFIHHVSSQVAATGSLALASACRFERLDGTWAQRAPFPWPLPHSGGKGD